jgi:hypothetical protein
MAARGQRPTRTIGGTPVALFRHMSTDDKPLIGTNPMTSAAWKRAHPSPTADPQIVGDLDRLQHAERELGFALAVARQPDTAAMVSAHQTRALELRQLITSLGGAPSDHGLRELPHEPDQIAGLGDARGILIALADDARALADLYQDALRHAAGAPSAHDLLARNLAATRTEADGYAATSARL